MRLLPGLRPLLAPRVSSHQGGWDEILLFVGLPIVLFVVLRVLGTRRERREEQAGEASDDD